MELLQLTYFVESAKSENFSHTAEKFFVPVSSVSASVRKLEQELGCLLFDRQSNKIKLNKNGKLFYNDVSVALGLITTAKDKLALQSRGDMGHVSMLVKNNKSYINEQLIGFRKAHENFSFHLLHRYTDIDYQQFDIIVDEQNGDYKGYLAKPVLKERIYIIASVKNPLCGKPLVLNDLRHCAFVSMGEAGSLGRITKTVCQNAGFSPHIVIEDDTNDIIKYVEEDFGVAFISEKFMQKHPNEHIARLNVTDFDYTRITYLYLKDEVKVSKAARAFFGYVEEIE